MLLGRSRVFVLLGTSSCRGPWFKAFITWYRLTVQKTYLNLGVGRAPHLARSLWHSKIFMWFLNATSTCACLRFSGKGIPTLAVTFWLCALLVRTVIYLLLLQLSDKFGELLAQSFSSPLCALRDVVLADNFFSHRFADALSKGMRKLRIVSLPPLRKLDVSNNKICDR